LLETPTFVIIFCLKWANWQLEPQSLYKTSYLTLYPNRVNPVPGTRSYHQHPTWLERVKMKWMNQCQVWSFDLWKVKSKSGKEPNTFLSLSLFSLSPPPLSLSLSFSGCLSVYLSLSLSLYRSLSFALSLSGYVATSDLSPEPLNLKPHTRNPKPSTFLFRGAADVIGVVSSELGTYKTVKARFWPWLQPFFRRTSSNPLRYSLLSSGSIPRSQTERGIT